MYYMYYIQGRYEIYQVIADMLSIMIDNTTKKSNLSTILISIKRHLSAPHICRQTQRMWAT